MSSLFDIYIRGINPDRLDEADKIKQKACKALQIELQQLEAFLSAPGGKCVLRGAAEETAQQYQATLSKAGLICVYTPSKGEASFSLVPVEGAVEVARTFICPNCGNEMPIEGKEEHPDKCDKCFITIGKFLLIQRQDEEREELKKRILNQQSTKKTLEAQQQEKELEDKRRKAMEKEILDEILTEEEKKAKKMRLIAAGVVGVLFATGIGFYEYTRYSKQQQREEDLRRVNGGEQAGSLSGGSATGQSMPDGIQGPAANQFMPDGAQGVEQNADLGGGTEGQQSMKQGFDKANKVLNAFGLDAGAIEKNAGGGAGGAPRTTGAAGAGVTNTAGQAGAVPAAPAGIKEPSVAEQSVFLLQAGDNSQEWDLFLSKAIANLETKLSSANALEEAQKLAKYIVDTEVYIDTMGQLLAAAQQAKQAQLVSDILFSIETRITALPADEQAAYFAQAGFYQSRVLAQNGLFARGDAIWKQMLTPVSKLKAALKIAVAYYKAGKVEVSNSYFNQTNALLERVLLPNEQVTLRAAIGRAYNEVNNPVNATEWLVSADSLLTQITQDTLQYLVESYAVNNQFQSAIDVVTKYGAKLKQAELFYAAVKASLKINSVSNAIAISKEIKDPAYSALASDLIASYDINTASSLLESGEKLLQTIANPVDKVIVAMRLARHYARIGNQDKASGLFELVEQQISAIPASSFKDDVLAFLAKNYAQSLQSDAARKSAASIASVPVKARVTTELQGLTEVSSLLGGG